MDFDDDLHCNIFLQSTSPRMSPNTSPIAFYDYPENAENLVKWNDEENHLHNGMSNSAERKHDDKVNIENIEKAARPTNLDKKSTQELKAIKKLEREKKKESVMKEKALKNAVKRLQKNSRPEECIKNLIVNIDETILQHDYGEAIKIILEDNGITYKSMNHLLGLISWTRKIQTIENLLFKESNSDEKHYLIIMQSNEFSNLVDQKKLLNHIHHIQTMTNFQHLTIVVLGIEKPSEEQEYAIIEVEMFVKCYWQLIKKPEDLASLVFMVTKSVAMIPHKLKQQEKLVLQNEYFNDSNKDTVKVDKNGNGLSRLWSQMLTMFPLARLETAEAITAAYPTPAALFKAYDECELRKQELLQNLPIRRAQGPLSSVRKIGPELSRKCYNFFTSNTNQLL